MLLWFVVVEHGLFKMFLGWFKQDLDLGRIDFPRVLVCQHNAEVFDLMYGTGIPTLTCRFWSWIPWRKVHEISTQNTDDLEFGQCFATFCWNVLHDFISLWMILFWSNHIAYHVRFFFTRHRSRLSSNMGESKKWGLFGANRIVAHWGGVKWFNPSFYTNCSWTQKNRKVSS